MFCGRRNPFKKIDHSVFFFFFFLGGGGGGGEGGGGGGEGWEEVWGSILFTGSYPRRNKLTEFLLLKSTLINLKAAAE